MAARSRVRGESPQARKVQAERALHLVHDVALDGERQGTPPDPRPEGAAGMIPKPATVALLGGWRASAFALAALVLLLATGVQTLRLHYVEGRLDKWAKAAAQAQVREQFAQGELQRLRKAAPKAGKTIREVVKADPSDCRVPAAGQLRDAIRQSNAARGLPSNAVAR